MNISATTYADYTKLELNLGQQDRSGSGQAAARAGDRVSLSLEGKNLAYATDQTQGTDSVEQAIERIEERIKEIEKEIQELSKGNLPEEEKEARIQVLEQELAQLNAEKAELLTEQAGGLSAGGTPCRGLANSLS
ncbi:MAG: FlxA-like family protein [Desulfovibrionaceae bacterium]|nr:FlxA-like family protein [Desulfovibrionaceae bacterium]